MAPNINWTRVLGDAYKKCPKGAPEVAAHCGVSEQTVRNWLNGQSLPDVDKAWMFLDACGMPWEGFLEMFVQGRADRGFVEEVVERSRSPGVADGDVLVDVDAVREVLRAGSLDELDHLSDKLVEDEKSWELIDCFVTANNSHRWVSQSDAIALLAETRRALKALMKKK